MWLDIRPIFTTDVMRQNLPFGNAPHDGTAVVRGLSSEALMVAATRLSTHRTANNLRLMKGGLTNRNVSKSV